MNTLILGVGNLLLSDEAVFLRSRSTFSPLTSTGASTSCGLAAVGVCSARTGGAASRVDRVSTPNPWLIERCAGYFKTTSK